MAAQTELWITEHLARVRSMPGYIRFEADVHTGWGSGTANFPNLIDPLTALQARLLNSGRRPVVDWCLDDTNLAVQTRIAHQSDVCVVFASADSGEGYLTGSFILRQPRLPLTCGVSRREHGRQKRPRTLAQWHDDDPECCRQLHEYRGGP